MTETTGYEAQTIHRLLELNGMPEEERDGHSAKIREECAESAGGRCDHY